MDPIAKQVMETCEETREDWVMEHIRPLLGRRNFHKLQTLMSTIKTKGFGESYDELKEVRLILEKCDVMIAAFPQKAHKRGKWTPMATAILQYGNVWAIFAPSFVLYGGRA